jgi:aspartate racemase
LRTIGLVGGTSWVSTVEYYRIINGEREFIHRTIHEELVRSAFLPGSREGFLAIIRGLAARGAQGIVLGCTEIPLLVEPDRSPLPAFDTTRIHGLAAVDFALSA